ncbi:MAG: NAD(P)-dependent oxidoreductase [Acidobacteriota bacterium]
MAKLGFVGLGLMGSNMAKRLLDAGHDVTGTDLVRSKADWLANVGSGLRWADTPRAVVEASEVVFSSVTNTAALQAITSGPDGIIAALKPGQVYADMSTVSPETSREIAAKVEKTGAAMLDSPVSGTVISVQQGVLAIMVGGPKEAFEKAKPYLLAIGPKVTHVGGNGLALAMKIAVNLNLQVQMQAFCEAVLLAEKSGIARETAVEVLTNSAVASPMVKYRGPFILKMPEVAWFNVGMMQKDMNLALQMGQKLDVPLPTTAVCNEFLTAARGMGLAEYDMAIVFDVLAAMAGINVQR